MAPTFISLLTPPGRSALASFAIQGPHAWTMASQLFRRAQDRNLPEQPAPGRFFFGKLGAEAHQDEVVLAVRSLQPLRLEIHAHGGPEVAAFLLESFERLGAQTCPWPEMEVQREHALGHGPARAAALLALSQAPTVRTAGIFLDQLHGAWDRAVAQIHNFFDHGHKALARRRLERLCALAPLGRHLIHPWKVVVAGAPNVGKSSLVNALAGYQRALVSPRPGTTRDAVTTTLALDGWPVEIIDTAGLRETEEALEQAGMDRARTLLGEADLVLWLVDGAQLPVWPEQAGERMLVVINKVDLPPTWDWSVFPQAVQVSAAQGLGLKELMERIVGRLVQVVPNPGEGIPFTAETEAWVTMALATSCLRFAPASRSVG